jgi:hypothetical protein
MENILTTRALMSEAKNEKKITIKQFKIDWESLKFNYYSIIVVTLLASTMLGSAAAMVILQNNASTGQLSACVIVSMVSNSASICNLSIKPVTYSFLVSLLVNTALILMNI